MASVVFTEPAEYDLLDIEHYIFVDLCNPQASERITEGILEAAERLGEYPTGHPLVEDDVVYIIRVLYNRVDWQTLLKR